MTASIPRAPRLPAEGERNAIRGYSAQYRIAAELIHKALLDGELEWIRVADPTAGRVDDIQIGRTGRVDAYQIKWSEYENRVSFRSLIIGDDAPKSRESSMLGQLADGWTKLIRSGSSRVAHVHLIMRASASDADDVQGTGGHFQAFLRHAWGTRAAWGKDVGADPRWSSAIEVLRGATGLDEETFAAFAPCMHLHLGYRLADVDSADRGSCRYGADLDYLAAFLFRLVADERRTVEMDRAELVRRLGWGRRLDLRFRHDFPVDERIYQPISGTVSEVEAALANFCRGYIALVGTPGSGKSTTLTQMLRYRPGYRVIRYYAFVRGDTAQGRGEAESFLSDVTLAIRRSGVNTATTTPMLPQSRAELAEMFGQQLAALHEEWRANQVRTLVLIDGLDHIAREQRPEHSLTEVLPSPSEVPDGVLIVLGSQQVGLRGLTPRILGQLEEPGRMLTMHRLERRNVFEITRSYLSAGAMSGVDFERVWSASAGHPLALAYLLKRLILAPDADTRRALLDTTAPFTGEIEQDYRTHWDTLRDDVDLRDLMGILCRLRGSIDLDLLSSLASEEVLLRFSVSAAHFFHQETASRWTFFHNSFRQYLLIATGRDAFARPDSARQASFHIRLADACARHSGTLLGWERLYHLNEAGNKQAILGLFTQSYFREQFMAFRPLPEILEDVARCLRAALAEDDRIAIIRALLIEHELGERNAAMENVDLPTFILRSAKPADRADAAIHSGELVIPLKTALALAGNLLETDRVLACRLFDLAEPVALLNGLTPVEPHHLGWLEAWAEVAWRFHPVDVFLRIIGQITTQPGDDSFSDNVQEDGGTLISTTKDDYFVPLLEIAASASLRAGADNILASLEVELAKICGNHGDMAPTRLDCLRAELTVMGKRPWAEGQAALDRICRSWPPNPTDPDRSVTVALLLLRLGGSRDRIQAYIEAAPVPIVRGIGDGGDARTLDDLRILFFQARVLAALSRPLDPVKAVPENPREHHHGAVLLNRMIVLIGSVRGEADAGTRLTPDAVLRRLSPAMNLYNRSWRDAQAWTDWHAVRGRAEAYFDLLLRTADAHGRACMHAVLDSMFRDWKDTSTYYWPANWRRAVLLTAHELDEDRARTIEGLSALSDGGDVWTDVHGRVAHHEGQVKAWLDLGEWESARLELAAMLHTSFGVYHRDDDQYERWCWWAARMVDTLPTDQFCGAMRPLFRGMVVMHGDNRGHNPDAAASTLMEAAAAINPGWARDLHRWLLVNKGASRHASFTGFLKGILRQNASNFIGRNVLLASARLVAPFETMVDEDLAFELGKAAYKLQSGVVRANETERLLQVIATEAYPHNRAKWAQEFSRGSVAAGGEAISLKADVSLARGPDEAEAAPKPIGLTLSDRGHVSVDEILRHSRDPARFADLAKLATSAENLPWEDVLNAVLGGADGATLALVCAAIAHLDPPLYVHAWFAGRFAELGRHSDARTAVDRAWANSKPYGWAKYYDGGSRLVAADAAILVDGELGRKRVLEFLVRDYLEETRHPGTLLRYLDRLVGLLFSEPPMDAVWTEVAEHAAQLAEIAMPAAPEPPVPSVVAEDATVALVQIAFDDLDHPVQQLGEQSRKFLLDLLADETNRPAIANCVLARLARNDDATLESTLALLCGALDVDKDWVAMFVDQVHRLTAVTNSGIVNAYAMALLSYLDRETPPRQRQPLPAIYTLRLPPTPMPDVSPTGKPRRGKPLENTDDPIELAGTLRAPLATISAVSGISMRNLASRIAKLMPDIAPRATWDCAAEQRLLANLESARLKISYRRPRVALARLALGRLVQELVDADVVTWPVDGLDQWLFGFDPLVSMIDASARPEWLLPPTAAAMNSWSDKDWVRRPEDCLVDAPFRLQDEYLVLAERTEWVRPDRGRPTEIRATQIGPHGYPWNGRGRPDDGFFFKFPGSALGAEYPAMWRPGARIQPMPVLEGGGWLRPEFLAFSPALAFEQGWQPSGSRLFAWENQDGALMVESLRWRDGNLLHHDWHGQNEVCGEGWIVVATRLGWRALSPLIRGWRRYLVASRILDETDEWPEPFVARREQALGTGSALDPITPLLRT